MEVRLDSTFNLIKPSHSRIPKTGELIQVIAAEPTAERPYQNGDIFEVGFAWTNKLGFGESYGGITTTQGVEMFDREFVILDGIEGLPPRNPHDEAFAVPMGAEFGSDEYEFLLSIGATYVMPEEPAVEYIGGDKVDHPSHYKQGKFETIEIIEEITQGYTDGYVSYCVGNSLKYLARAPFKHDTPVEDLRKAAKYIEFALKRLESSAQTE